MDETEGSALTLPIVQSDLRLGRSLRQVDGKCKFITASFPFVLSLHIATTERVQILDSSIAPALLSLFVIFIIYTEKACFGA
ncbi:hypothetical protein K1719_024005 [Acacia pycnantha]|nr:hypothetical protein K1719_024005 [Acacia pycnantha]